MAKAVMEDQVTGGTIGDEMDTDDVLYSKPQVGWDIALVEELAACALFVMARLVRHRR
jgi:hypothetical protein